MMKKCNRCADFKLESEFSLKNPTCKSCVCIRNKLYWRTSKGRISAIYAAQVSCTKARKHVLPTYSREQLYDWACKNNLESLMTAWKESGYLKDYVPSVDRIDPNQSYTLQNIRLVTWRANNEKAYTDRKNCTHITKQNRRIEQLTLNGTHVAYHDSISSAARATNAIRTNINCMCTGNNPSVKSVAGFIWRYA